MNKIAILIDGAFFLKRLPSVRKDVDVKDCESVTRALRQLVGSHLTRQRDELYNNINKSRSDDDDAINPYQALHRCFFYDSMPFEGKTLRPISRQNVDFSKSDMAKFRNKLHRAIKKERSFALRLGEVKKRGGKWWSIRPQVQNDLIKGTRQVSNLTDDDFALNVMQKGVDMRLGVDIAHLALKQQVNTIILVTGDADFVPAAKLARREGVKIILDPLWQGVGDDLYEHIDDLYSGFPRPKTI